MKNDSHIFYNPFSERGYVMKKQKIIKASLPFAALLIVFVIFKILQPERFGTISSMYILLQQTLMQSSLACGFYFLMNMGIFDMTIGVNALISAMTAILMAEKFGPLGFLLGALATSVAISFVSGQFMIRLDAPPMIISVGFVVVYEAVSQQLCRGAFSLSIPQAYRILGLAPLNMIPGFLLLVVAGFLLKYTRFGLYVTAIGSNGRIAEAVGINVKKYKTLAFFFCGICTFIYGIVTTCYASSVASASGMSSATSIFKPLMAVMFATSFKKYLNPMVALLIGCFFLNLISNGLLTNGLESSLQNVIVGLAMILVIRLSSTDRKYDVVK